MKTIYVNENQIKETINQVEINIDNINKAYDIISKHKQCTIELLQSINKEYIDNEYKQHWNTIIDEHGYNNNNITFASSVWDMFRKMTNRKVYYLFDAMNHLPYKDYIKYYDIVDNKVIIKPDYKELIRENNTFKIDNKEQEKVHTKLEQVAKLLKECNIYPYQVDYFINANYNINHSQFIK